jgi:hypothetical protein
LIDSGGSAWTPYHMFGGKSKWERPLVLAAIGALRAADSEAHVAVACLVLLSVHLNCHLPAAWCQVIDGVLALYLAPCCKVVTCICTTLDPSHPAKAVRAAVVVPAEGAGHVHAHTSQRAAMRTTIRCPEDVAALIPNEAEAIRFLVWCEIVCAPKCCSAGHPWHPTNEGIFKCGYKPKAVRGDPARTVVDTNGLSLSQAHQWSQGAQSRDRGDIFAHWLGPSPDLYQHGTCFDYSHTSVQSRASCT